MQKEKLEELLKSDEFTRLLEMVRAIYKFRLFFIALVFSILAFSMQFSVSTKIIWIKVCEFSAWFFLISCGMLSLKNAGGLSSRDTERSISEGLSCKWRCIMWGLFISGIVLLALAKVGVFVMKAVSD